MVTVVLCSLYCILIVYRGQGPRMRTFCMRTGAFLFPEERNCYEKYQSKKGISRKSVITSVRKRTPNRVAR